jgi:hypothetical protein
MKVQCCYQERAQQALAADSPASGFFGKLSGRAAQAQRWAAEMIPAEDHATSPVNVL